MKVSLNWLKEFVNIPEDVTSEKLAEELTLKTVEVEGLERIDGNLDNIVIGKIEKIAAHPNADKLRVCIVDIGEEEKKAIVCGGSNLREGMLVAVAKIGAKVKWHGEGELVEIKKTEIRGIESEGMICAASEIGLENIFPTNEEREVIDLETKKQRNKEVKEIRNQKSEIENVGVGGANPPAEAEKRLEIGKPLAEALDLQDIIIEIDNKSLTNRPDLWGHFGIAREVAAILKNSKYAKKIEGEFLKYPAEVFKEGYNFALGAREIIISEEGSDLNVEVQNPELCPQYMAIVVSNIRIQPSPEWMQKRLSSLGMRPINNIVDVTNYVMLEMGQPMHAFNQLSINNCQLTIRNAKSGEKIKTLEGVERELDTSMLVIADSEKAVAIAGVMGGENSEIGEGTTSIIFESANFDKVNIRKTSAKLGLRTEASIRYEKGLDPALTERALGRCVELIEQILPEATVASNIIAVKSAAPADLKIEISTDYITKKIGIKISEKKISGILESLGFTVESRDKKMLSIKVPAWRATGDVSIADDIVEEIARIYGYNEIEPKMPLDVLEPPEENKERKLERKIKNILSAGLGMSEASYYSFVGEKQVEDLGFNLDEHIKLANPLSSDQTILRTSLIPNLLKNAKDNLRYFDKFKMFEIGSVFKNAEGDIPSGGIENAMLPWQEKFIAGIVVDSKNSIPFYEAKNIVEELLKVLGIESEISANGEVESWMHPYRKSKIKNQKSKIDIGYITELNSIVAEGVGIKNARVGVFNLSLKALLELASGDIKYSSISRFPAVERDIAVVVEKHILAYNISKAIKEVGDSILKDIKFFDYYEGAQLPEGKKSLAYRIIFQSDERTLEDKEVDEMMMFIVSKLEREMGAVLRK